MSQDKIERRLTAVESEVSVLRQESKDTRVLAVGADRDVSEFRAELRGHTRVLGALRETQLEQGRAIAGLTARMDSLDRNVSGRLTEILGLVTHLVDRDGGAAVK